MMVGLTRFAPAKVNLYLHIVGRRPDGYHLLDSLAVFAGAGDRLSAEPAADFSLTVTGPFAAGLDAEGDNLVLRAGRALAAAAGMDPSGRLVLEKNLPVASGIGGGSADAAAAFRLLSSLWGICLPADRLAVLAAGLGADVPVCLSGTPARMQGIGEVLETVLGLPPFGLVLVNPGTAIATPAVFKARSGAFSEAARLPARWEDAASLAAWLSETRNDLEQPAGKLAPVVGEVLAALRADPRCLLARMSGSGATCFGLFDTAATAQKAAAVLARPGWWVWGGSQAEA
jgi:4-diphosphocytidyl-2-C-methyl-D-erythritol kinase